jgi:hypothetical protein
MVSGRVSRRALGRHVWSTAFCGTCTTTGVTGAKGATCIGFSAADVSDTPVWIDVDLGADRAIGAVTLQPRTDTGAVGGGTAGFPVDFTLRTRAEGAISCTTVRTITGQPNPQRHRADVHPQRCHRPLRPSAGHQAGRTVHRREHASASTAGPQTAMLGIGRLVERPWAVDGRVEVRKVVHLSLTFDHRVCDGGTAAGFPRHVVDGVTAP